jgi:uncharacterized protein (TIGR03382 family)
VHAIDRAGEVVRIASPPRGMTAALAPVMLRSGIVAVALLWSSVAFADPDDDGAACTCDVTPAACDAGCACDTECDVDWSVDECTAPGAGCQTELADTALDAAELATPDDTVVDWPVVPVTCPDGAALVAGSCIASAASPDAGGCNATGEPALIAGAVILGVFLLRRRRALLALAIASSCAVDAGTTWDDAVDAGPSGGDYLNVMSAELGDDSVQYLLAGQALDPGAQQPVAQFSLARTTGGTPIYRSNATSCGDRLDTSGDELLGWASSEPGDATAELVELTAPNGCSIYETDAEAIADLEAGGYAVTRTLGHVWPPGWNEPAAPDDASDDVGTQAATCSVDKRSAMILMYASPGSVETLRFLLGCPGEVAVGEKAENGPRSSMRTADAHALGGRTAFVLGDHGNKLRALLDRPNGVERTAAYFRHKLALGYDYIVIDEITTAGDWADGGSLNQKFRKLLLRVPPRTVMGYVSIDLLQYPGGQAYLTRRRLLMRALKLRGRALALEVYLHTGQAMAGEAPSAFRLAANRLSRSVHGLARTVGINTRAITTIGTSMHSTFAQYRYLDQPAHDLESITRQVNALRHASWRTRQQHGVGYYFVDKSDMAPISHYSYDALIRRMRTQALRFR